MSPRPASPRRWTWMVLSVVISAAAIAALLALHGREQEAREQEQVARSYAARLQQSIAELTPLGQYLSDRNPALLRRLIASGMEVSAGELNDLRLIDPAGAKRIELLLSGVRQAAGDSRTDTAQAAQVVGRALAIATQIADRERDRAERAERQSLYGSTAALLFAVLLIVALLTRERQVSLAAARRHAAEIQQLADHDALTGLPNRRSFDAHLHRLTAPASGPVEVGVCDLNGFKEINDRLGHHAGDSVLVTAARDLQAAIGDAGTVYRTGGDEFCVVSEPGRRIGAAARHALEREGQPALGSVGLATWPTDDPSIWAVVRIADTRMYEVKRALGGRPAAHRL